MAGVLGQIEREIAALEGATAQLAEDLEKLYGQYLEALGRSVQQQLIMASYHLCTQAYPDRFLALSFSRRQKLQQTLRKLGKQAQDDLQKQLKCLRESPPILSAQGQLITAGELTPRLIAELAAAVKARIEERESEPFQTLESDSDQALASDDTAIAETDIESDLPPQERSSPPERSAADDKAESDMLELPLIPVSGDDDSDNLSDGEPSTDELDTQNSNPQNADPETLESAQEIAEFMQRMVPTEQATAEAESNLSEQTGPRSPMVLAQQQMRLEHQLRGRIRALSQEANQMLKRAEILPDLPEPLLAAAAEAEAANDSPPQTPNLLNVFVEMPSEDDDDDEIDGDDIGGDDEIDGDDIGGKNGVTREDDMPDPASMTHLVALNLRLSEIEFVDTKVSLWRTKIREQLGRLKRLGQQYQKKQRDRAIAEAETAWRSSWYED
ncbi:MAG: hypothetical protein AAFW84_03035 [Cyanobacteria bacterium J06635_15]